MSPQYEEPGEEISGWLKSWGAILAGLGTIVYGGVGIVQRSIHAQSEGSMTQLTGQDAMLYGFLALIVGIVFLALGLSNIRSNRK